MIDYKIRNRANRVVLKGQQGLNLNFDWFKFGNSLPAGLKSLVNSGVITEDTAWAMYKKQQFEKGAQTDVAPATNEVTETANDPTRKEIRAQEIADRRKARQQNQDQRLHDKYASQTYGKGAKYNSKTGTYQVFDDTTKEYVDAPNQPLEGDFEQWKSDREASTQNMVGQLSNAALGVANQVIDSSSKIDQQSSFGSAFQSGWDSASDLVGKINPMWGAIAKGAGTVMKAVDNIFATDSDSYSVDDRLVADLGGSYGGTVSQMEDAASRAGKYGGLFSNGARRRANKAISKAKHNQSILNDINQVSRQQQDLVNQMGDQSSNAYQFDLTGGYKQQYMRAAKEGGVIEEKFVPVLVDDMIVPKRVTPGEFMNGGVLKEIINPESGGIVEWEPELVDWTPVLVDSFKPGGKIEKALDAPETEETEQKSVIPEGSLHKDKHHMENTDGMTKKGIPVVDDDSKQQAEIERNEIIFTKEVTKKLEELYKVYYDDDSSAKEKDEAAIDAGKLLTKEIMLNTDDRTGLIDTLKKGGSIKSQTDKPPVKKTEVVGAGPSGFEWMVDMTEKPSYEEWVKDVNPDYLSDNYDLEKAFEVLPYGDLQRWKKVIGTDLESQLPVESWHLPSVWFDRDNDVGIFLKKGQTVEENPELQYEFDAYKSSPEMQKEWKMVYDPEEGRWMYVRR